MKEREREGIDAVAAASILLTLPVSESLLDSRFTSFTGLHPQGKINLKQYLEGSEALADPTDVAKALAERGKGNQSNKMLETQRNRPKKYVILYGVSAKGRGNVEEAIGSDEKKTQALVKRSLLYLVAHFVNEREEEVLSTEYVSCKPPANVHVLVGDVRWVIFPKW